MMKINMVLTANSWDIEEEFGISVYDCPFTDIARRDSYVYLPLNDESIADIENKIHYCKTYAQYKRLHKYENELALVHKFRELGYTDYILIFLA